MKERSSRPSTLGCEELRVQVAKVRVFALLCEIPGVPAGRIRCQASLVIVVCKGLHSPGWDCGARRHWPAGEASRAFRDTVEQAQVNALGAVWADFGVAELGRGRAGRRVPRGRAVHGGRHRSCRWTPWTGARQARTKGTPPMGG